MTAILASSPTGVRLSAIHGHMSRSRTLVRVLPTAVRLLTSSAGAILGGSAVSLSIFRRDSGDIGQTDQTIPGEGRTRRHPERWENARMALQRGGVDPGEIRGPDHCVGDVHGRDLPLLRNALGALARNHRL